MCDAVRQAYVKNIVQAFVVPALAKYARAGHPTFQNGKGLMVKGWATRPARGLISTRSVGHTTVPSYCGGRVLFGLGPEGELIKSL